MIDCGLTARDARHFAARASLWSGESRLLFGEPPHEDGALIIRKDGGHPSDEPRVSRPGQAASPGIFIDVAVHVYRRPQGRTLRIEEVGPVEERRLVLVSHGMPDHVEALPSRRDGVHGRKAGRAIERIPTVIPGPFACGDVAVKDGSIDSGKGLVIPGEYIGAVGLGGHRGRVGEHVGVHFVLWTERRSTVKPHGMVRILHIDAEISAEPMPFGCEHIVDSGLGWLISMEK